MLSSFVVAGFFVFWWGGHGPHKMLKKGPNLNHTGQPGLPWDWSAAFSHDFELNETEILIPGG